MKDLILQKIFEYGLILLIFAWLFSAHCFVSSFSKSQKCAIKEVVQQELKKGGLLYENKNFD